MTKRGAANIAIICCIIAVVPIVVFINWAVTAAADWLAGMGTGR